MIGENLCNYLTFRNLEKRGIKVNNKTIEKMKVENSFDWLKEYEITVNFATWICDNVNNIYTDAKLENEIKEIMKKLNLKINENYLNTLVDYLEKKVLYIESECLCALEV